MVIGLYGKNILSFIRNHQIIFHAPKKVPVPFCTLIMNELEFLLFLALPSFSMVSILDFGHSNSSISLLFYFLMAYTQNTVHRLICILYT